MADIDVICGNHECRIAKDGKCIEGHDVPANCPFYGREQEAITHEPVDETRDVEIAFDGLHLPEALPLDSVGANRILTKLPSRVIAIIGAHDSGKTSLIAGLFDLFQIGRVSECMFAGSSTLQGFESICHDARAVSERNEPHSERTKRGEVRFYHIDVKRHCSLHSLLIADRSGEEYEEVADRAVNASGMFELRRADVVTLLVDGRRLTSPLERADAIGSLPLIIRGMVENGAFQRTPSLAIVLTKNDAVQSSQFNERAVRDFDAIATGIRDSFSEHFDKISAFVTCASPSATNVVRGTGLAELLDFWLKPRPQPKTTLLRYKSDRVFDGIEIEEVSID